MSWLLIGLITSGGAGPAQSAEPSVVVTLKPVHSLVAAVMAGTGEPHLLLDANASPHAFSLKPADARRLANADLLVRVSPRLEVALVRSLSSLGAGKVILTLDQLPGIRHLPLRGGGAFGAHSDHHEHAHGTGKASDHALHDGEKADDPHIWLDPVNAVAMVNGISQALTRIAPQHGPRYKANATTLLASLGQLEQRLRTELAPIGPKRYLVFHDAYQYFESRFGLSVVGAVTTSPEIPPSAHRLRELRARIRQSKVVCVFAEPQFSPRIIATILEGTSVRQGTLDPLGAAIPAGPGHYFALLEALGASLRTCLSGPV